MGRFYTPVQAEFTDNFIYKPPWEMAMGALSVKEGQIQDSLSQLDLLQNIPIDFYKDYDEKTVENIRKGLEDNVEGIVQDMRKDVLNPSNGNKLSKLQKNVLNRFETGDIADVLQSAKNYKKFEEQLSKMTPYEQEQIKSKLLQKKLDKAQGLGSTTEVFDAGILQSHRDLSQEFIKDALENNFLKPEYLEEVGIGKYIIKTGEGGLSKERIEEAFKKYVETKKEELTSYNNFSKDIYDQSYLDEEGNLDWNEGSTLKKDLDYVKNAAYENKTKDVNFNPGWQYDQEQKARQAAADAEALAATTNSDLAGNAELGGEYIVNGPYGPVKNNIEGERRITAIYQLQTALKNKEITQEKYDKIINLIGTPSNSNGVVFDIKNPNKGTYKNSYSQFLVAIGDGKHQDLIPANSPLREKLNETNMRIRLQESWSPFNKAFTPEITNRAMSKMDKAATSGAYPVHLGTQAGTGYATSDAKSMNDWKKDKKALYEQFGIPMDAEVTEIKYKQGSIAPRLSYNQKLQYDEKGNIFSTLKNLPMGMAVDITYTIQEGDDIITKTLPGKVYTDPNALSITDYGNSIGE